MLHCGFGDKYGPNPTRSDTLWLLTNDLVQGRAAISCLGRWLEGLKVVRVAERHRQCFLSCCQPGSRERQTLKSLL